MRKGVLYILCAILVSGYGLPRGDLRKIVVSNDQSGIEILKNDISRFHIVQTLSSFSVMPVNTPMGEFSRIIIDDYTGGQINGSPELPVLNHIIEVPAGAEVVIQILSSKEEIIKLSDHQINTKIYPSQPSVLKSQDPGQQPFHYSQESYAVDQYNEIERISINKIGKTRGRQIAHLQIAPFQYNPVQNVLKVTTKLEIEIQFKYADAGLQRETQKRFYSPLFEESFKRILNYRVDESKSFTSQKPLKYVILSDPAFSEALQPFIEWKTRMGFNVIEAYKGDTIVGSTKEEMKAYLKDIYLSATPEDPAPTYLLIVGDHSQIPAFKSDYGHYTDLYYSEYDGEGDYFPELLYGRFSANDTSELNPQIEKIIEYEQYLFPDPTFLDEVVMIAGVDWDYAPVWGNGQINYGTSNYFEPGHGITSHTYLYHRDSVPVDKALIIQNVSDGAGFVNYTGHGSVSSWLNPSFTLSDIETLLNDGKYPLMIGNGCQSANFYYECFGEALVRAKNKGALSYIGCTNDSYWDEDYYWAVGTGPIVQFPTYEETGLGMYDRTFHDHGESESDWYPVLGQMIYGGNLAVVEGNPSRAKYYWEIYHVLGDPSLMIYFSQPDPISVDIEESMPTGIQNLFIQAEPYSYVGLTKNGVLLDARYAEYDGLAVLQFQELSDTGKLDLVITKQNRQPFIDSIRIISSPEPYVVYESLNLCDTLGIDIDQADHGSNVVMKIRLKNLGESEAIGVYGYLSTSDPFVSVTDTVDYWSAIPALDSSSEIEAFIVEIADSVPDGHNATFKLRTTDTLGREWISYFELEIYSPIISSGKLMVNDLDNGNGNLKLEPDESLFLELELYNNGRSEAKAINVTLRNKDGLITIQDSIMTIDSIGSNSVEKVRFPVTVDALAESGSLANFQFIVKSSFTSFTDSFSLPIGLIYEDFENYAFNQYNWYNDSIHPWIISNFSMWEGKYSAQSANISHGDTSVLAITLNVLADDTISFYRRVSSESNYDYLKFYIDTLTKRWSGEQSWALEEFPIGAGIHTIKWIYAKDGSVNRGHDKAWIDFVVFPKNSFTQFDIGVMEVISPLSGIDLSDSETISVKLKNFGNEALTDIPVSYQFNSHDIVTDTIRGVIPAGTTFTYDFVGTADLSNYKVYELMVFTSLPTDEFPGNNNLNVTIENLLFIDTGIEAILAPAEDTTYSSSEEVKVLIRNFGNVPISNFLVFYSVNEASAVGELVTGTIAAGSTLQFTFAQPADLSSYQTYNIVAYTQLNSDVSSLNDTAIISLVHNPSKIPSSFIRKENLLVYPNPTSGVINLSFEVLFTANPTLTIRNLIGKVVWQKKIPLSNGQVQMSLDLGNLPAGMYFISFETKTGRITRKILKK